MQTKPTLCVTASAICLSAAWWTPGQTQEFLLEEVEEQEEAPIYNNEIEAGIGYNSEDSFKFGEHTGLTEEGPFPILNFRSRYRAPYDSESTTYYGLTGRNLGLGSRSVEAEFGEQGNYDLFLEYNEIPQFLFDDGRSPYSGRHSGNLTLPSDWVAAPSTAGFTELDDSQRKVKIETKRKDFAGGLTWHLTPRWSFGAEFRHEEKEGLDTLGGAFGTNGGNPSAVILPEVIDYETNIFDASVQYAGKRSQLQLDYELSVFNDQTSTLRFQNPYSQAGRGAPWAPETGFATGFGEFALPPDNTAHRVSLSGAYNLGATTRVVAHAAYGRMEQDENFLPFSAIPALEASVTTPLPRNSANAKIDTYLAELRVSSRPLPKLDVQANYRYDRRDNRTASDVFVKITADSQTQPASIANANARINLPYDYEQHKADFETGYRILSDTKISLGYTYDQVKRKYQEEVTTRENTVRGRVASSPFSFASGWVEYGHGFRNGSNYKGNRIFQKSHTPEYLATLSPEDQFENHPDLRKFTLANRDRDFVNAAIDLVPHDQVIVGLRVGYSQDNYDDSELGLTDTHNLQASIDVSYSPRSDFTSFAYFTYEQLEYKQRGYSWNSASTSLTDPAQRWSVDTEDSVYTTGVGFDWSIIPDTLKFTADYVFSYANTSIKPRGGSALTFASLPDIKSTLHSVGAGLEYTFREGVAVNLGYVFEDLSTDDFALDGIEPNTMPFVLTLGQTSPDYSAHVVGVSLKLSF